MKTAMVFKSGNSQAVRLPRDFNLDVAKVQVFWKDGDLVLRPLKRTWQDYFDRGRKFSDDFSESVEDMALEENAPASDVMRDVFPFCPSIGDDKLAQDDFSGNRGYRPNCRDVVLKLTRQDIAADLFKETSAQQKHVIDLLFRANGFLYKNHAGEPVIGRPSDDKNPAGSKLYDCIAAFAEKAKKNLLK